MAFKRGVKSKPVFVELLDMLKSAFEGHVDHRFTFAVDEEDLNFCCVYCHTCKTEVIAGTRDLIELVWLDLSTVPLMPH